MPGRVWEPTVLAMSTPLTPQLDDFERRLRELETELAELRALTAGAAAAAPTHTALPQSLEELIDRGDFRALFRQVERCRQAALTADDLDTLLELNHVARRAAEQAPVGVEAAAVNLGYTIRQNVRFVARKLGADVDEAALSGEPPSAPVEPGVEEAADRLEALRESARTWDRAAAAVEPEEPRPPRFQLPELNAADLLGAKALAIAGGIVTLLGIVFFFVLAVNRGWVGPEGRIGLGAAAAVIVYGAGLELRRRYGETYSSLAAVAAGIAGGYGVLLAAAQLYHFVGHLGALVIAVAIAGLALVTALRWRSQMVAALGLLG